MRLRSMRASPFTPKALAMSRLPVVPGFWAIQARISSLEGSGFMAWAYHAARPAESGLPGRSVGASGGDISREMKKAPAFILPQISRGFRGLAPGRRRAGLKAKPCCAGKMRGNSAGDGRSERIRTSDPLLPKQVRYQTALRSDRGRGVTARARALQEGRAPFRPTTFCRIRRAGRLPPLDEPAPGRKPRGQAHILRRRRL